MIFPKYGATAKVHRSGFSKAEVARSRQIQYYLDQKMKLVDIADHMGMTRNAVQLAIYRYGLKRK